MLEWRGNRKERSMIAQLIVVAALLAPVTIRSSHSGVATGYGKPGYNPDKMICVSRDVIGSRLQAVRECHTAQQWEDQKLQETVGLNRQQFNGDPGCQGNSGASCHPMGTHDTPW
jgi:hypothetical protein